ncbi:MAG: AzlC family ABC transporter permease [Ruminococcus flavefaciens]|nr:AzlC family ABC transporter permease [Ruminococcus flavefaciens]MCM1231085.1 AzlC family ABC transporter permease [Ruminococcus flavefaciens]
MKGCFLLKSAFFRGMSHGIPIALGYLSVSFGFGISAVRSGLSVFEASAISATSLTSAGQAAGVDIISAGGTLLEMILVQLTINIRYSLMALSLSQKLDKKFTTPHRLIASYGITDEIFALCSAQPGMLVPSYMYGMILVSAVGWIMGTFLGAYAGQLLPESLSSAMGILLYGMFLAIIIPPSRKHKNILCVVISSAVLSLIFRYFITAVSSGFAVIICAVISAVIGAVLFPVRDEEE